MAYIGMHGANATGHAFEDFAEWIVKHKDHRAANVDEVMGWLRGIWEQFEEQWQFHFKDVNFSQNTYQTHLWANKFSHVES